MSRTWDFIAKIVIIGDSGCGKSSLTIRLTDDRFSEIHDVTIAAEIGSKILPVGDAGEHMKLQLWDTAGQEHFRSITRSYFRNAAGCILVYDVTRKQTFEDIKMWLGDIREQAQPDICLCLVGNKCDLEERRQVSTEEAQAFADANDIPLFVETSAKTGQKVVEAYSSLSQLIHSKIVSGRYNVNDKSHGVKAHSNNAGLINLSVDASAPDSSCAC